jgi:hypothetical protein
MSNNGFRRINPMPVEMKPVQSSHVNGIGYDAEKRELHVDYRGRRAVYQDVPPDVAEAVQDAPSTGQALNLWVRGTYAFSYLKPDA